MYYFNKLISGTLFSVTVLSHNLKINDAIIGAIACTFDILAAISYVFVAEPWQLYFSKYKIQYINVILFIFLYFNVLYTNTYTWILWNLSSVSWLLPRYCSVDFYVVNVENRQRQRTWYYILFVLFFSFPYLYLCLFVVF